MTRFSAIAAATEPAQKTPAQKRGNEPVFTGLLLRFRGIADIGQRVVFRQDADDRGAFAPARHERRRHAGHASFQHESFLLQNTCQQLGGAVLFERDFRVVRQGHRPVLDFLLQQINRFDDFALLGRQSGLRDRGGREKSEQEKTGDERKALGHDFFASISEGKKLNPNGGSMIADFVLRGVEAVCPGHELAPAFEKSDYRIDIHPIC